MTILHCCSRFFPDRGGSETYTSSLMSGLRDRGITNVVASAGEPVESYEFDGIAVHRLGWAAQDEQDAGAEARPASQTFAGRFDEALARVRPSVVHFHARTGEWSGRALAMARRRGLATVLTYHMQSFSCPRGDLMRFGERVCDGRLLAHRCLPCKAHQFGIPKSLAPFANFIPSSLNRLTPRVLARGRLRTGLELKGNIVAMVHDLRAFLQVFDRIVVLSEWGRTLLVANGVRPEAVVLSRLGTHHPPSQRVAPQARAQGGTLRGVFVGRVSEGKGVGVLTRALAQAPRLPISVDVFGPLDDSPGNAGPFDQRAAASGKATYRGILADDQVVDVMSRYDFVVVPTQVPETGPFTVVEGLQAGVPVLGSDIGAINELITHEHNGLLVPVGSVPAWTDVFKRIVESPAILDGIRSRSSYSRTMSDVADEMADLYQDVQRRVRDKDAARG